MVQILIVTDRKSAFQGVIHHLEDRCGAALDWAGNRQAAMDAVTRRRPDLALIDHRVSGQDGLALCRDLLQADAFVNLALVSDLDDEAFHEASEGLGLLGRLPLAPSPADLDALLAHLARICPPA